MSTIDFGARLKQHVDAYCGPTPSTAFVDDDTGLRVATFVDKPDKGLFTALTIGLSGHAFTQPRSNTTLRQELLICVDRRYCELPWHEVLLAVGKQVTSEHKALMLGEVLGPAGPLFPEAAWCSATALLCSLPTMFDAEFAEPELDGVSMIFVELIPITTAEAEWVKREGWSAFFDRVNSGEVNILDLHRQ